MGGLIIEHRYFEVDEDHKAGEGVHMRGTMNNRFHSVVDHIDVVAYQWLGPFFFVELGSTVLIDDGVADIIGYSLLFFVLLFIGQFASAAGAAKYVPGGFSWSESAMIGFGMMGRAELFFVVLDLCYNQHNIMTKEMFCCFAITAMLMNISVPVCISLYRPYFVKYNPQCAGAGDAHGHGDDHGADDEESNEGKDEKESNHKDDVKKPAAMKDLEDINVEVPTNGTHVAPADNEKKAHAEWVDGDGRTGNNASPVQSKEKKRSRGALPMICGCAGSD